MGSGVGSSKGMVLKVHVFSFLFFANLLRSSFKGIYRCAHMDADVCNVYMYICI